MEEFLSPKVRYVVTDRPDHEWPPGLRKDESSKVTRSNNSTIGDEGKAQLPTTPLSTGTRNTEPTVKIATIFDIGLSAYSFFWSYSRGRNFSSPKSLP